MRMEVSECAGAYSARISSESADVLDVFGMSGRRDSATESRILQGRDARSVRVLVPLHYPPPAQMCSKQGAI